MLREWNGQSRLVVSGISLAMSATLTHDKRGPRPWSCNIERRDGTAKSRRTSGLKVGFVLVAFVGTILFALPCAATNDLANSASPEHGTEPDPALHAGVLNNGLRYEILRNVAPPSQVSIRLRMSVGSLDEGPDEGGLAHFVEHMVFRGSTNFADGAAIERLEAFGVKLGPDVNAYTEETQTVFEIDLPHASDDATAAAFNILRDFAGNVLLTDQAVDSERRVVMSEFLLRDTGARRRDHQRTNFVLQALTGVGDASATTIDSIKRVTRNGLAQFYVRNYRPERATIVITGDMNPDVVKDQIQTRFGDWIVRDGSMQGSNSTARRMDRSDIQWVGGVGRNISLFWVCRFESVARCVQSPAGSRWIVQVGLSLMNRRLQMRAIDAAQSYLSAEVTAERWFHFGNVTGLSVSFADGDWRQALTEAESLRRGTLSAGFSQSEVDAEAARLLDSVEDRVKHSAAPTTRWLADRMVRDLNENRVSTSPSQDLQSAREALTHVKAEAVISALKTGFEGDGPFVSMVGLDPVPDDAEQLLREGLQKAESAPPRPVVVPSTSKWPYTTFGSPGAVLRRRRVSALGATLVEFANGVRLNIKPTMFAPGTIDIAVAFGSGRLGLSPEQHFPIWAADNGAFIDGGLKAMDSIAIGNALGQKQKSLYFDVADNAFMFHDAVRSSDLDTHLEVMAAYFAAPAFRPATFEQTRNAYATLVSNTDTNPINMLVFNLSSLLRSGDRRWAFPTQDEIAEAQPEDLRTVLLHELARAPIEVTLVGDLSIPEAIRSVRHTLGALGSRSPSEPTNIPEGRFPAATPRPLIVGHSGRQEQGAAAIAWPTLDMLSDLKQFYSLQLLSQIIGQRLSERLRSGTGSSYLSRVISLSSETAPPSTSYLFAYANIRPSEADIFFGEVSKVVENLTRVSVSPEELEGAKRHQIDRLTGLLKSNGFWLHWLNLGQRDPRRLQFPIRGLSNLRSVTTGDLQRAAITYLKSDAAVKVVVERLGVPDKLPPD